MAILSSWPHLRSVGPGYWRAGAESLGELLELEGLHIGGWPMDDLRILGKPHRLEHLCIVRGKMGSLEGIPEGVRKLEPHYCPRLADLSALRELTALERLDVSVARSLKDVTGLEGARNLSNFFLDQCGPLRSLEPIRGLDRLTDLWLEEGAVDATTEAVDALYGKRELRRLFIPRKSGLRPELVRESAPHCDVLLLPRTEPPGRGAGHAHGAG